MCCLITKKKTYCKTCFIKKNKLCKGKQIKLLKWLQVLSFWATLNYQLHRNKVSKFVNQHRSSRNALEIRRVCFWRGSLLVAVSVALPLWCHAPTDTQHRTEQKKYSKCIAVTRANKTKLQCASRYFVNTICDMPPCCVRHAGNCVTAGWGNTTHVRNVHVTRTNTLLYN